MGERASALEKGGMNLNLLLSHYANLEKNNHSYLMGFLIGKRINVHKI